MVLGSGFFVRVVLVRVLVPIPVTACLATFSAFRPDASGVLFCLWRLQVVDEARNFSKRLARQRIDLSLDVGRQVATIYRVAHVAAALQQGSLSTNDKLRVILGIEASEPFLHLTHGRSSRLA